MQRQLTPNPFLHLPSAGDSPAGNSSAGATTAVDEKQSKTTEQIEIEKKERDRLNWHNKGAGRKRIKDIYTKYLPKINQFIEMKENNIQDTDQINKLKTILKSMDSEIKIVKNEFPALIDFYPKKDLGQIVQKLNLFLKEDPL